MLIDHYGETASRELREGGVLKYSRVHPISWERVRNRLATLRYGRRVSRRRLGLVWRNQPGSAVHRSTEAANAQESCSETSDTASADNRLTLLFPDSPLAADLPLVSSPATADGNVLSRAGRAGFDIRRFPGADNISTEQEFEHRSRILCVRLLQILARFLPFPAADELVTLENRRVRAAGTRRRTCRS